MTNPATTSLLDRANLDRDAVRRQIARGLEGADDGELFLEYRQSEALVFDNGRLKQATYDTAQGFGLRAVEGRGGRLRPCLRRLRGRADRARRRCGARRAAAAIRGTLSPRRRARTNVRLYGDDNPLDAPGFEAKVKLLAEIDAYARDKDPRVRQVIGLASAPPGRWSRSCAPTARRYRDIRPLVRLNVSVVAGEGDRQETGSHGYGGREGYARFIETKALAASAADEALRQALVNLEVGAGAGRRDGRGARPRLARRAAARGGRPRPRRRLQPQGDLGLRRPDRPAVARQGRHRGRRRHDRRAAAARSSIDDEGTPTSRTVLIEDGILVGYMQDRQNARLMGMTPTGNGRRESYAHVPMPRMTNTYMLAGDARPGGDHRLGRRTASTP